MFYGHTHPDHARNESSWEKLPDHLNEVARRAAAFAAPFGCSQVGEKLGLWHDLGKFSDSFQDYLKSSQGDTEEHPEGKTGRGPDHSTAGARLAASSKPGPGHLLAYALAGHHSGLPDGLYGRSLGVAQESTLEHRLNRSTIRSWEENARSTLPGPAFDAPAFGREHARFMADGYAASFWVRMLFSCLVDADFLATEAFMNESQARVRNEEEKPSLDTLAAKLSDFMSRKTAVAADTPVNRIREHVRDTCLAVSGEAPGLFSLTVPTGGGKTLASLTFALEHARRHGLARIVYVIPFTSIIEQNADVFREALGKAAVLEHHSNFDGEPGEDASAEVRRKAWQAKLASENWDSPVIVTTGVQFFESLHAHKPSRCRKLHNLAKAVIVLDEAQTLPLPLLQPCLRGLEQLTKNYGSTVVLCTATQPAVGKREHFACGLEDVREIMASGPNLHAALRRADVVRIPEKLPDETLAGKLAAERSVLCVVNTRKHARQLFEKLRATAGESPDTPESARTVFHLSAQMCPVHRTEILDTIRHRLKSGKSVRLVSTQLIEAGVDVDFPCVWRVLGGLDAIAQAAGRCNREGRLGTAGRVFVFESADHTIPAGFLRQTAESGAEILGLREFAGDPLAPEAIDRYFRLLYDRNYSPNEAADRTNFVTLNGDAGEKRTVVGELIPKERPTSPDSTLAYGFRTLGENFRLIEETAEPVIVPYGEKGRELCEALRLAYAPDERRRLLRKLQRYTVSIPKPVFATAIDDGRIQKVHDLAAILTSPETGYSSDYGVSLEKSSSSADLII